MKPRYSSKARRRVWRTFILKKDSKRSKRRQLRKWRKMGLLKGKLLNSRIKDYKGLGEYYILSIQDFKIATNQIKNY